MKLLTFISFFVFAGLNATAQTNIQLILKDAGGYKIEKVDMFDLSQTEKFEFDFNDTLVFSFKKKDIDCYYIRYFTKDQMFRKQVWFDAANVNVEAHLTDKELIIDTVINSPFYYRELAFNKRYWELFKTGDTAAINNFLLSTFEENIDNLFSLNVGYYYVMLNQNAKLDLLKLKSLTDKQGSRFDWFFFYPMTVERLNKLLTVDKINFANYTFINKSNSSVKLSLTGAEYYILDLWFLACVPCVEQHVEIKKMHKELKKKNIEVIGISTDNNVKYWKVYLDSHGYAWQNYLQGRAGGLTNDLNIYRFPTYIILDKTGGIIDTYNSFSDVLKRFQIEE